MKTKALAVSILSTVLIGTFGVAGAQRGSTPAPRTTQTPYLRCADGTCRIQRMIGMNFGGGIFASAFSAEPNPTYLAYATSLFNPKEYKLDRVASIVWPSADGKGDTTLPLTDLLPMPLTFAVAQTDRTNKSVQWEPHRAFLDSSSSTMVELPPAVSTGPVDPIGHIWCLHKGKTKSNQSNDRLNFLPDGPIINAVSASTIQISLESMDRKQHVMVVPLEMGAIKLTKADAGRTLDAGNAMKKMRDWVQNSYDKRTSFEPTVTNVLQFDVSSAEAAKLSTLFHADQVLRVKVRFPWLCDLNCDMSEPLNQHWITKISGDTSRVVITNSVGNSTAITGGR